MSNRQNGGRISVTSMSRLPHAVNDSAVQPINQPDDNDGPVDGRGGYINKVLEPVESGFRRISTTAAPEYSRLPKAGDEPEDLALTPAPEEFDDEDLDGDSLDEDVADSEDIAAKYECCGEARLNCFRFTSEMQKEGRRVKASCSKLNFRGYFRRLFSMDMLRRRLPIIQWAPKYSLTDLQGDLVAGTTVGLTVLPQAIAYASLASVRSEFGLYSSYIGSIVYTFLGSAKDITLGPSAVSSLMTLTYALSPVNKDPSVAIMASFLCGFVYIGMFIFGLGFFVEFTSMSVMKAFMVASSITIAASQFKRWWGLTGVPSDFLSQLYWTLKKLPETRLYDFLLGFLCIILISVLKKLKEIKWKRKFRDLPLHLKILKKTLFYLGLGRNIVAIVLATIATYIFYINDSLPFSITGSIPPGIPPWKLPNSTLYDPKTNRTYDISDFASIIGIGFILIPVLGLLEAMAIGGVFARRFGYRIDPNQELLAYGVGNVLNGLASGYPICGTFSRTAVNAQSGVRTQAGGIVTAIIVLLAIQFLTPVFYYIPNASLSCVIILAVLDMVTFQKVWIFWKTKKIDLVPWILTFVLSFCISIAWGVIIGMGFSILLLLYPSARPKIKVFKRDAGSILGHPVAEANASVMVVTFDNGLMYPAIEHMKDKIIPLYQAADLPKGIVFDFIHVSTADTTTVMGMRLLLDSCQKKGIVLVVCNLQKSVETLFRKSKAKFYRQADNVEAAVKLIFDVHSANQKKSDDKGAKDKMNNNNLGYDNPSLSVIDETDPYSADGAVAAPSTREDGKQTVVDGRVVSAVVDDTVIKTLVRQEADRIIRQNP